LLWPKIEHLFHNIDFLAAHNAGFDQNVLHKCCAAAGIVKPRIPFKCSMVMARRVWRIYPTNLASVCQRLSIPLNHHEASSDAEACAKIMIMGMELGK